MLRRNDEQSREVISEIAKQLKTTNTTNNIVLPVIDQSQEAIDDAVHHHYSRSHFFGGQRGWRTSPRNTF